MPTLRWPSQTHRRYTTTNFFRLHRMPEMQTFVTDVRGVRPSVCLSRGSTRLHCVKTAEQIKILFGVNTLGGPKEHRVRRESWSPTARGGRFDAAFAELLWPLVTSAKWHVMCQINTSWNFTRLSTSSLTYVMWLCDRVVLQCYDQLRLLRRRRPPVQSWDCQSKLHDCSANFLKCRTVKFRHSLIPYCLDHYV